MTRSACALRPSEAYLRGIEIGRNRLAHHPADASEAYLRGIEIARVVRGARRRDESEAYLRGIEILLAGAAGVRGGRV